MVVSNNLDPDEALHFVGPHLDQKMLAKIISRIH